MSGGRWVLVAFFLLVAVFIGVASGTNMDDTEQRQPLDTVPVISVCGAPVTDLAYTACWPEDTNG